MKLQQKKPMWQRFTPQSKSTIYYAQETAKQFYTHQVSTEHILLGLLQEGSITETILNKLRIPSDSVKLEIESHLAQGSEPPDPSTMTLSLLSKRVIDYSYDEARQEESSDILPKHLLMGLIREQQGLAGQVLRSMGITKKAIRTGELSAGGESVWPPPIKRIVVKSVYEQPTVPRPVEQDESIIQKIVRRLRTLGKK